MPLQSHFFCTISLLSHSETICGTVIYGALEVLGPHNANKIKEIVQKNACSGIQVQ